MKNIYSITAILVSLILLSCGSSRSEKANVSSPATSELVEEMQFEIQNTFAFPLAGNRIDLIDNPNYIRFEGDSVKMFLPYYGERFSGGGYGRPGGINYEGPIKNLSIEENKNGKLLKFEGNQGSEFLQFFVTVFPGGKANTSVNSSERSAISYQGRIDELPKNENN